MIKISGYQDDDIHLLLGINKSNYQEVLTYLKNQGFPKIGFFLSRHLSTYTSNYLTVVQSPEFLDNFLKVLIQIEPSVQAISNTIYHNTRSYLKTKITIPGWIRSHSFCLINTINTRPLKRALYYQAIQPTKIKQLDLLGYADNHVDLNIAMNTDGYLDFLKLFSVKANFQDLTSSGSNTSIKIRDSEHLITLLEILRQIDPSVSSLLIADIINRYDPNYVPSRQQAFLMGYHSKRVGQNSPISFLTKPSLRGEPQIARDIFSFLFYSPVKRKQTTQQSEESDIEKLRSGDHSAFERHKETVKSLKNISREKENPSNSSMDLSILSTPKFSQPNEKTKIAQSLVGYSKTKKNISLEAYKALVRKAVEEKVINRQTADSKKTALYVALEAEQFERAKILLEEGGADPSILTVNGDTALKLADRIAATKSPVPAKLKEILDLLTQPKLSVAESAYKAVSIAS